MERLLILENVFHPVSPKGTSNEPTYLYGQPIKEVQSPEEQGFTRYHYLFCADYIYCIKASLKNQQQTGYPLLFQVIP